MVLYADRITKAIESSLDETNRRRTKQLAYNKEHGITPKTILKNIKDITEQLESDHDKAVRANILLDEEVFRNDPDKLFEAKNKEMQKAVAQLDFETAAIIRDEIRALEEKLKKKKKRS